MMRFVVLLVASATLFLPMVHAQDGPYKVLKTARVGGEGGWDYIYADSSARRLYIPRGAVRAGAGDGYVGGDGSTATASDGLRSRHSGARG